MLAKARKIAGRYSLILKPHPDLGFTGRGVELSFVLADGRTEQECAQQMREALTTAVATLLELDQLPPPVADEGRRAQVNVRLSRDEQLFLTSEANRQGYSSLSDFMRAAAIRCSLAR